MPTQPLGPTGLLAQSMTLPAGSQSMAMGGMGLRSQGMDGRKKSAGPSLPTTTFDPTFGSAWLSNGSRTVTGNTIPNYPLARSSTTKSAGKYYFEVASPGSAINVLGVITPSVPFGTTGTYTTNTGVTLLQKNGLGWRDGASSTSGISTIAGATYFMGIAVDLDNRKVWIKSPTSDWNGTTGADPATNTGGFVFGTGIAVGADIHAAASPIGANPLTINFGASTYQLGAPSGFSNWT